MEIIILFRGSSIFKQSPCGYGYTSVWLLLSTGQCDANMDNEKNTTKK